ncbi:MAG: TVP38/TMEM64 family protein [Actinomycetota bacterium]
MHDETEMPPPSWPARFVPVLGLVLLIATLALALRAADVTGVDELRDRVDDAGWWGPVLFVVLYAVLTVALVPGSVGSTAAGVLFGAAAGTALTVVGATLGAAGSFLLGRALGRSTVTSLVGGGIDRVDRFFAGRPLRSVISIRLIPVLPFNLVNYAAGFTSLPFRSYVLGTAIGIIPGSTLFVALGASLDAPGSPRFWASLGGLAAFMVLGVVLARRTDPAPERTPVATQP